MRDEGPPRWPVEGPRLARLATLTTIKSLADATRLMEQAAPDSAEMPCLNPWCSNLCSWPKRGRPPLYCSRACKDYCTSERRRLAQEIGLLEEALQEAIGDGVKHRSVRSAVARKRWLLLHFPLPPDE